MPKKIPFFTTLPPNALAVVNRRVKRYGLKRWQIVAAALHCLEKEFPTGGPRRKARGKR